jgi:DNA-binding IclR family transcriptional regulator
VVKQPRSDEPEIRAVKPARGGRRSTTARDVGSIGPRAVDRAAAILLSFSFAEPRLSLAQIAEAAHLPKPSAYRIVSSLVANGLVCQAEDGRYEPGFRLFELGSIARSRLALARVAADLVQTLAEETGETVLLTQVEWPTREVVIVAKVDASHPVGVLSPLGRRSQLSPGCLGKAALAGLPPEQLASTLAAMPLRRYTEHTITSRRALKREIELARQQGYGLDVEEYLPGVSGVASWIHLGDPRPAGAIGIVGPTQRLPAERLEALGQRVAVLAHDLSFTQPATAGA